MDPREKLDDMDELARTQQERHQSRIWTMMPVSIPETAEDEDHGFVAKLQPTIKSRRFQPKTKEIKDEQMTDLGRHCPIAYPQGGGLLLTHPVEKDDEGIALFASRSIDHWWDKGGIQPQSEPGRWHHLGDAIYLPGVRSKPRKLGGNPNDPKRLTLLADGSEDKTRPVAKDRIELRTEKGEFYITLTKEGEVHIVCKTMLVTAKEKVHFDTPLIETTGDIKAKGEISCKEDVKSAQYGFEDQTTIAAQIATIAGPTPLSDSAIHLSSHKHDGVEKGGAQTNKPVAGT